MGLLEIQCVRNTCMDDWIVRFSKQSILFKQVKYFSFLIYIDLTISTQRDQKLGNFTIFDLNVCDGTSLLFYHFLFTKRWQFQNYFGYFFAAPIFKSDQTEALSWSYLYYYVEISLGWFEDYLQKCMHKILDN